MNQYLKLALYGLLIWAVPYIISMGLYPTGIMTSEPLFFKSLMVTIGGITGLIASVFYLRSLKNIDLRQAWIAFGVWLIINWVLDFVFLIPYSGQSVLQYFKEIGLDYLAGMSYPLAVAYTMCCKTKKAKK